MKNLSKLSVSYLRIYFLKEVSISIGENNRAVAGVVSHSPAYLMNTALTSDDSVEVAMMGRVPCKVTGVVNKGDRLVSSNVPGHAMAGKDDIRWTHVVGRALEKKLDDGEGIIEVIVGVK